MVVCKYWRQGNCRNGNSCRFEHPSNEGGNRQGSISNGGIFGNVNRPERWHLNEEDIKNDLTNTRPKWILSTYGPGKETPAALFVDNEFSAEEVRLRFYQAQAAGNADAADREAIQVWQKAEKNIGDAASNVQDIQRYMEQKEKEHPNRYDFCRFDGTISKEEFAKNTQANSQPGSSINPFGGATRATASSNPFSKPSFGQTSSPFGQSSQSAGFGQQQSPQQQQSAFGQTSQPSAFGKPAFGQSGFGQNTQPSGFGKSPFGQTGFGQTGFNQPKSSFGQPQAPSAFGGKTVESSSGFGQASNLGQGNPTNAFARPSAAGMVGNASSNVGFGTPAFGQLAATTNNASPFAQTSGQGGTSSPFASAGNAGTSPFGSNNASKPGFGQQGFSQPSQQQSASPFGQPSQLQQQQSGFGSNPFAQKAQQPGFGQSPFGQPQQAQQQQPGFGKPGFGQTAQPSSSGNNPFNTVQSSSSSPFANLNNNSTANQSPFGNLNGSNASQSPFGNLNQNNTTTASSASNNGPMHPSAVPQQTVPTQPAERLQHTATVTSASKPTSNPVRPLHYTETLPNVPAQFQSDGKLASYRNLPVQYDIKLRPTATGEEVIDAELPVYQRPDGRGQERIWFPRGPAEATVQRLANVLLDFQFEDDHYNDTIKSEYARLFENGRFEQGKVPLIPPMRGWIDYDF